MYLFHNGTNIMIPDAIIKNKFLKLKPPPDMISVLHSHIQRSANNPNPIALPIPIHPVIRFHHLLPGFLPVRFSLRILP